MCSAFAKAFSLCLKNRYGLLISTAPPMPNLFAQRVLADIFRLPTLVDLRDAWPDLLDYLGEGNTPTSVPAKVRAQLMAALGGVTKVAMRRCIRRAGALTVTSADFAASLRERTHSHVGLVYNTLDAAPAVIAANRQVAGELRILYAGNIGRAQGLGTAFDALRILQRRQIPVRLRLVGGGAHLPTLRRRAKEAQLPVEFVSRVRREELGEHFEWAHTALVTLRDWEPLRSTVPSKLFEDLYRGIHVTVSANGESAKIISAARAGSAVPAGDGLALADLWQDLYEHPAQLQVGGAGRTWISQHAASAQQTRNFLEAVAAATRPLKQRGKV